MIIKNDGLGDRMKTYENVTCNYLTRRTPIIIRLDGKAFHTFTKGFDKPFDKILVKTMQETMQYLCQNIMGCVLGYTQSDEITLVLCDYKKLTSQAWYDNNIQKMCSISASMATMAFNQFFAKNVDWYYNSDEDAILKSPYVINMFGDIVFKQAMFDSRVFNIPKEEVNNCLLWRQQDATRNSIQSVAQANFSHKHLQGLNCDQLQEKLWPEKGINWNNLPVYLKRGSCCIKNSYTLETENGEAEHSIWEIDENIPKFSENTDYINGLITFE